MSLTKLSPMENKIRVLALEYMALVKDREEYLASIRKQVEPGNNLFLRWSDVASKLGNAEANIWERTSNEVYRLCDEYRRKFRGENVYKFNVAIGRG